MSMLQYYLQKTIRVKVWVILVLIVVLALTVVYREKLEELISEYPYYALGVGVILAYGLYLLYKRDHDAPSGCAAICNSPNQEDQLKCMQECEKALHQ